MKFKIYCDNLIEGNWFAKLHASFSNLKFSKILPRGKNNKLIEELIKYDRPDIILADDKKVYLVIEKSREVPTGHNVGQRMARLVRSVELKIPTIKFFPFDAKKHGRYSGICNLNIRILLAFEKIWKIHNTPIIAVNWIADNYGELIDNGNEDNEIKEIISNYIETNYETNCKIFLKKRKQQLNEYSKRLKKRAAYGLPPNSVFFINTKKFINSNSKKFSPNEKKQLNKNSKSLIYLIKMTEENCRREDPYTGTQFIYDYAYCRKGVSPSEKINNLILNFPLINKKIWLKNNPNDEMRKSCNWYLIANALVFNDGAIFLR